jgi:hypothetical protein
VAIDGDTVVVGAYGESSNGTAQTNNSVASAGAAYVFVRSGTTWTQQAYLKDPSPIASGYFGLSVAIEANRIAVGAPGSAGRAFVFDRTATIWSAGTPLTPTVTLASNDAFGSSVAVSGNTIAVGAPTAVSDFGAAFIFVNSGTAWTEQATLNASNAGASDQFGFRLDLKGDNLLVGAYAEDSAGTQADNSASTAGAAYYFRRTGVAWAQLAYVKSPMPATFDYFGADVALSGTTMVCGASGNSADRGAAFVFAQP